MESRSFGNWQSPISAEFVFEASKSFPHLFIEDGAIYWIEKRAYEQGRSSIIHLSRNKTAILELLFKPYDARTTLYEYGGRSIFVKDKIIYFTNHEDQNIYRIVDRGKPELVFADEKLKFGDFIIDHHHKFLFSVCEQEGDPKRHFIAKIDLETHGMEKVADSADFYASPILSPDGSYLAYIYWNHPDMSWDSSYLDIYHLGTKERIKIAGGPGTCVLQPQFGPDGKLYFVSDESGYFNFYTWNGSLGKGYKALYPMEADCSDVQWQVGIPSYTFLEGLDGEGSSHLIFIYIQKAVDKLGIIDLNNQEFQEIYLPYTSLKDIHSADKKIYFIGASPESLPQIIELDMVTLEQTQLAMSRVIELPEKILSFAEPIETKNGSYALYYPPTHPDFSPLEGQKPPMIVRAHSGPTSHFRYALNLEIQYWTSQGWSYLEVNYHGSSGFGRAYRQSLDGNWGELDAKDCIEATQCVIEKGLCDPRSIVMRGGSAGGYTALHVLAQSALFKAAALYYPVTDLIATLEHTHKFEKYYNIHLIGPYPEKEDLYKERSPLHFIEKINAPLLIFQGEKDVVVSKSQTDAFCEKLKEFDKPFTYHTFASEGHGFRTPDVLSQCLEMEKEFYLSHLPELTQAFLGEVEKEKTE